MKEVVERRRETVPMLLPDGLFPRQHEELGREGGEEGADVATAREGYPGVVGEEMLFQLRESGFDRQSPDPAAARRGRCI